MRDRVAKRRIGRGNHSAEFKRRAVTMMGARDQTLKEIGRQLGVSVVTLIKWRRKLQKVRGADVAPQEGARESLESMTEAERLRVELVRVTEERDRLRQSLALLIGLI